MSRAIPPDNDLLDRYLANECSAEERAVVDAWVTSSSEHAMRMGQMRHAAAAPFGDPALASADEIWHRVMAAVDAQPQGDVSLTLLRTHDVQDTGGTHVAPAHVAPSLRRGRVLGGTTPASPRTKMAWLFAGLAVVLALGIGRWAMGTRSRGTSVTTYATHVTRSGEVIHLTLADGSRMTLAPNSRVDIARDFMQSRNVILTGEAYFEVTQAHRVPFLVRAGAITTRVLGTAFDVRHEANASSTRITVVNGKVAAGAPRRSSVTLIAGAVGTFTDSTAVVTMINDVTSLTDWTSGHLRFRETPVVEVLAQVGRWYGVEFRLADSTLTQERVTAALDYKETSDAIRALEHLLDVTATADGLHSGRSLIVLQPRRSRGRNAPVRSGRDANEFTHREVGR